MVKLISDKICSKYNPDTDVGALAEDVLRKLNPTEGSGQVASNSCLVTTEVKHFQITFFNHSKSLTFFTGLTMNIDDLYLRL